MATLNDLSSPLDLLRTRKSASAKTMGDPGPTADQLSAILACAVRVPDHGKLAPWRFILWEGSSRARFGQTLRARWKELHPDHGEQALDFAQGMLLRAPSVLAVVSTAAEHPKIPVWEQQLSAGAVCMNILLAATALGLGCQWNTDWIAYDGVIAAAMGLKDGERVAGIIYLGASTAPLEDRPRPDPAMLLTRWPSP